MLLTQENAVSRPIIYSGIGCHDVSLSISDVVCIYLLSSIVYHLHNTITHGIIGKVRSDHSLYR